jgi:hypothetical protein
MAYVEGVLVEETEQDADGPIIAAINIQASLIGMDRAEL